MSLGEDSEWSATLKRTNFIRDKVKFCIKFDLATISTVIQYKNSNSCLQLARKTSSLSCIILLAVYSFSSLEVILTLDSACDQQFNTLEEQNAVHF